MLVRFSVSNWKSFRDRVTLSMVATRERQHGDRLSRIKKHQLRLLPFTVFYGGNASGKSNLCEAMEFAQWLVCSVTRPDQKLPVEPFLLDPQYEDRPTEFTFEILAEEVLYEFSFALTAHEILEEKLIKITSTSERVIYERKEGRLDFRAVPNRSFFTDYVFRGTRSNQLFLTNSVLQDMEDFRPVYDWFAGNFTVIKPSSKFVARTYSDDQFNLERTNQLLAGADTGISKLSLEAVKLEDRLSTELIPEVIGKGILEMIGEGEYARLDGPEGSILHFTQEDGRLVAWKMMGHHAGTDGSDVAFEIHQESAGTRRLIELLPALLMLQSQDSRSVFVIDELESGMHPLLTVHILSRYLSSCSAASRVQLLLTTHDLSLMDQGLIRRDEMWLLERDAANVSHLLSVAEFSDVDSNTDVQGRYLQGRLGGVPAVA